MTPIGGIGGAMRQRKRIKMDVVAMGMASECPQSPLPAAGFLIKPAIEGIEHAFGAGSHPGCPAVAIRPGMDALQPILVQLAHPSQPFLISKQVVARKRITLYQPHIAKNLEQHACRASGTPLMTQHTQIVPRCIAKKATDDFSIRTGCIIIGNLANIFAHDVPPELSNIARRVAIAK